MLPSSTWGGGSELEAIQLRKNYLEEAMEGNPSAGLHMDCVVVQTGHLNRDGPVIRKINNPPRDCQMPMGT